jgi:membrane associated rhomboid family serine protease
MEWYAGRNGESFGPFAFERLIEGAQSGELQRTDLVWRTGMDAWVSASTIPELWQQKKGREPIFLVPPVLWIPFLVFVGVNAGLLMFSGAQHTYLVRVLGFIPARYGGLSAQLPGGEITVWTSPFTYFLIVESGLDFITSSLQILGFATFLSLHWGKARFFALFLFCVLIGPALYVLWHGFVLALFVGTEAVLGGFQGAALWIKKPDPQTIAAGREPKPVRVTTGEILAILFNFIPIAAGILPIAALAMLLSFGLGALLRRGPVPSIVAR